jgi:hypothetical protein
VNAPTVHMEPGFAERLRDALEAEVERHRPRMKRRHLGIIVAALAAIALGGAGAATASLLAQPGASILTELGTTVEASGSGPRTIELGEAPAGSTGVAIDFSCADPGSFDFGAGGAGMTCSREDVDSGAGRAWGNLPLSVLDGTRFTVGAPEGARWRISLTYVNETVTGWSTNDDGDTFGVINQEGEPDLIAVIATNGVQGYVRADDLADADGTTASESFTSPEDALEWQESMRGETVEIPVYLSDGRTIVGVFAIEYNY